MENKKNRYVIGKNVYEKHIDDEVHLYGLLHQLAAQAERIRLIGIASPSAVMPS